MNSDILPQSFLDGMKRLLKDEYDEYIESYQQERSCGLRVNTGKISPGQLKDSFPFTLEAIPWVGNGFYYPSDLKPAKDPYYYAGLIYLQEPSAMTPASLLPIIPGDRVLDLCAAPGGKSTELGARLQGKGLLFSNDISSSRAKGLLKNLELWGISNLCVTSEDSDKLAQSLPQFFDKILIDAPCSGEGMFRKDPDMVKNYINCGPDYYAPIQRTLAEDSVRMLKPGGMLLYSTCTFSEKEDEGIIESLLEAHPELELVDLPLFTGASPGRLPGCLRLFPHKIRGEGHFMALLRKKGGQEMTSALDTEKNRERRGRIKNAVLPVDLEAFLDRYCTMSMDRSRIMIKNQQIYYLPESFDPGWKLRFLRTGLLLGEMKNDRFEPAQAFAMAMKAEEFSCLLSLNREDERVIRYLKGETLALTEQEGAKNGWRLVCVDGFPLGFAKGIGSSLKNKYYPGWRWQ